jgi:hypothetical protein
VPLRWRLPAVGVPPPRLLPVIRHSLRLWLPRMWSSGGRVMPAEVVPVCPIGPVPVLGLQPADGKEIEKDRH